jgi:rubrerythrin
LPKGRKDYIKDGILWATRATEEDRKKNYVEAIQLYDKSIELFTLALQNEKISETTKSNIASKSNEYSKRAEKLKAYIKRKNHPTNKSETPNINFELPKIKYISQNSKCEPKSEGRSLAKNIYASENSKSKPSNEGLFLAKQATEEDRKKNYVKAIELYENSVEMLNLALQKEKFSESSKSKISNMSKQYLERAEKLKDYISSRKKISSENSTKIEENLQNPNIFSCKICYESHGPQFILDCGHLPFCDNCSENIFSETEPKCPICRKKITQKMRAYF